VHTVPAEVNRTGLRRFTMPFSMSMTRNFMLPLASNFALLGCGGDDEPSGPTNGGADVTVTVQNNNFSPSNATVPVSGTVIWQWNSGGVAHNVTFADPGIPDSGDRTSGTFEQTFATAGTYNYQCTLHSGMTGVVNVTAGAGGDGGGGGGEYP
jgi:plastocyanin